MRTTVEKIKMPSIPHIIAGIILKKETIKKILGEEHETYQNILFILKKKELLNESQGALNIQKLTDHVNLQAVNEVITALSKDHILTRENAQSYFNDAINHTSFLKSTYSEFKRNHGLAIANHASAFQRYLKEKTRTLKMVEIKKTSPHHTSYQYQSESTLALSATINGDFIKLLGFSRMMNLLSIRTQENDTLVHIAAAHGYLDILNLLYRLGASANVCRYDGQTPLHLAVRNRQTAVLPLLLRMGAPLDQLNQEGYSALHLAVLKNASELVTLLCCDFGANINVRALDGSTAVALAASKGCVAMIELLHEHGADLSLCNKKQENPIFSAFYKNYSIVIDKLIALGVKIDEPNNLHATPLLIALLQKNDVMFSHLLKHHEPAPITFRLRGYQLLAIFNNYSVTIPKKLVDMIEARPWFFHTVMPITLEDFAIAFENQFVLDLLRQTPKIIDEENLSEKALIIYQSTPFFKPYHPAIAQRLLNPQTLDIEERLARETAAQEEHDNKFGMVVITG